MSNAKVVAWLVIAICLAKVALWAGALWVAAHFLMKFW